LLKLYLTTTNNENVRKTFNVVQGHLGFNTSNSLNAVLNDFHVLKNGTVEVKTTGAASVCRTDPQMPKCHPSATKPEKDAEELQDSNTFPSVAVASHQIYAYQINRLDGVRSVNMLEGAHLRTRKQHEAVPMERDILVILH
jgi:hypothetical protein